jgi:nucleoside-diphosphate-sugar epimerase
MQSLVLGATGIVGGYIVEHLLLSGEKPFALSRSPPKDPRGARWVSGDLAHPATLKFPRIETIYCTVEVGLRTADGPPQRIKDMGQQHSKRRCAKGDQSRPSGMGKRGASLHE